MSLSLTRRRMIGITAAAAGLSLLPFGRTARADASAVTWQGKAMGAIASITIHHQNRDEAERIIGQALSEVRRLEGLFSLYRDDSALLELNRRGVLLNPDDDFITLLNQCRRCWKMSGGAFDPTVQPLWTLYYRHFSQLGHDPDGPPADRLRAAIDKVGFDKVSFDKQRVVFASRGMGLTFNGIAQGFATDRVVDIFRAGGIEHSFVDIGEGRAIGGRTEDGAPWQVKLVRPDTLARQDEFVDIADRAIATSGGYGFQFDRDGRFNHLFNPRNGASAHLYKSVTVLAGDATTADGLSTAFSLMPRNEIEALRLQEGVDVRIDA